MTTIEALIDVRADVCDVYDQWTRFESFPEFMSGVERVTRLPDGRTHWTTRIAGVRREFDAEITEQQPDERLAWRTVDGPEHGGQVSFERVDEDTTRVRLRMTYEPGSLAERAGAGLVRRRIAGDLERFKSFMEGSHHGSTHAPRGPRGGNSGGSIPPGTKAHERLSGGHGDAQC